MTFISQNDIHLMTKIDDGSVTRMLLIDPWCYGDKVNTKVKLETIATANGKTMNYMILSITILHSKAMLEITRVNERISGMKHASSARSIARPIDPQPTALRLCYGGPHINLHIK